MLETKLRRWLPWVISWAGWGILVFNADVVGRGRNQWTLAFIVALIVSIVAGITLRRGAMNLLVAITIVIGWVRSWQFVTAEAWNPLGVWLLVIGSHLTMWANFSIKIINNLECQKAPTCPRRVLSPIDLIKKEDK